jgi:glutamate racemase
MDKTRQPIGIFDSGVGGLTVAAAIHDLLPHENLLYFGDTAHTPWGSQSSSAIQHYATKITQTLLDHHCKMIVIACNTASAAALEAVQAVVAGTAPVFNVIDPVIEHLASNYANKTVGLIGTKQTVKSQAYANRLQQKCANICLNALATPMLAPLIEEGFSHTNAATEVIEHYLGHSSLQDISALILGCTHYPLIKEQVTKFFSTNVEVIDSAQIVAHAVAKQLAQDGLLNHSTGSSKTFYVSHDSEFFNHTAKRFFPGEFKLQTYPLWD